MYKCHAADRGWRAMEVNCVHTTRGPRGYNFPAHRNNKNTHLHPAISHIPSVRLLTLPGCRGKWKLIALSDTPCCCLRDIISQWQYRLKQEANVVNCGTDGHVFTFYSPGECYGLAIHHRKLLLFEPYIILFDLIDHLDQILCCFFLNSLIMGTLWQKVNLL